MGEALCLWVLTPKVTSFKEYKSSICSPSCHSNLKSLNLTRSCNCQLYLCNTSVTEIRSQSFRLVWKCEAHCRISPCRVWKISRWCLSIWNGCLIKHWFLHKLVSFFMQVKDQTLSWSVYLLTFVWMLYGCFCTVCILQDSSVLWVPGMGWGEGA